MKYLKLVVMIAAGIAVHAQPYKTRFHIPCSGPEKSPVKAFVAVNGFLQKEFIKKDDLVRYGLQIGLSDTSFKIIGFVSGYDCHSGSIIDYNSRQYQGNRISAGDLFIRGIWVGDILTFDCINLERKGKRYLVQGLMFEIY